MSRSVQIARKTLRNAIRTLTRELPNQISTCFMMTLALQTEIARNRDREFLDRERPRGKIVPDVLPDSLARYVG